jgi:hypothetical protein
MTQPVKIILISLGCIGAGIGIYFLFFKDKKGEQFPDVEDESVEEKDTWEATTKPKYSSEGTILQMLSRGNNVKCLQSVLNVRGCKDKNGSGLTVDGKFGPLTESALSGCGEGTSISINRLKKMMQTELDKGLSIDCSSSSCCASLVSANPTNNNTNNNFFTDEDGMSYNRCDFEYRFDIPYTGIMNWYEKDVNCVGLPDNSCTIIGVGAGTFSASDDTKLYNLLVASGDKNDCGPDTTATNTDIHSIIPTGGGNTGYQYAIDPSIAFSGDDNEMWFDRQSKGEGLWDKVQGEVDGEKQIWG